MGKKTSREVTPDQGTLSFDGDDDFESTSQLMTNRTRFEALTPAARARLSETLMSPSFPLMLNAIRENGDEVHAATVEDAFQGFLSGALDVVESVRTRDTCAICHMPYNEGDVKMEQRIDWYEDGKKFYGEPSGEDAHARCIRHLREGGDAATKPLF